MGEVHNTQSRMWTVAQLNITIGQADVLRYTVIQENGMTEIINPDNGEIILRSLNNGKDEMVKYDSTYFSNGNLF